MNYSEKIYLESVRKTGFYEIIENLTSEQKSELIKSLNYRNFLYCREKHALKYANVLMCALCVGCLLAFLFIVR